MVRSPFLRHPREELKSTDQAYLTCQASTDTQPSRQLPLMEAFLQFLPVVNPTILLVSAGTSGTHVGALLPVLMKFPTPPGLRNTLLRRPLDSHLLSYTVQPSLVPSPTFTPFGRIFVPRKSV
ncbi:hypothetical protein K443DRAFT_445768 [Laccaria amethystina LaAM-08-1]|uniref:Uncharacterized protein n=1 Tax=Laccaria amethystina LaAM-08-1 TaxID=1095629 RepID=A0A0C9X383_9AGAR|nr:hypothetical protein K443DRAFT_445768 [Laccaria amethystina LaAM-08-1]